MSNSLRVPIKINKETTFFITCWACYTIEKSDVTQVADGVLCKKCTGILENFDEEDKGLAALKEILHRQWNAHGVPKLVQMKLMRNGKGRITRKRTRNRRTAFPRGKIHNFKDLVRLSDLDVQSMVEVVVSERLETPKVYLDLRNLAGAKNQGGPRKVTYSINDGYGNGGIVTHDGGSYAKAFEDAITRAFAAESIVDILAPPPEPEPSPIVFPSSWGGFLEVSTHTPDSKSAAGAPPRKIGKNQPAETITSAKMASNYSPKEWTVAGEMEYRRLPMSNNENPYAKRHKRDASEVSVEPNNAESQPVASTSAAAKVAAPPNNDDFQFAVPRLPKAKTQMKYAKPPFDHLPARGVHGPLDYYLVPLSSTQMTCYGVEHTKRPSVIQKHSRSSKNAKNMRRIASEQVKCITVEKLLESMEKHRAA